MSRSIYLASRFSNADALRSVRDDLEAAGHQVVSSWIDAPVSAAEDARRDANPDPAERQYWALNDLDDIERADTFVLIDPSGKRGGCYVELGLAIGADLDCFVVGERTNVFTYLCTRVASCDDLVLALS